MIKVENIETWGFEHAIRGMRNAMNSWSKSDSKLCKGKDFDDCTVDCAKCPRKDENFDNDIFCIGKADLDLMRRLCKAGADGNFAHRKFLRQIFVCMDITAPDYFFKEFSTYKVGVTENSTSTMHRIHSRDLTLDDFSHEHLLGDEKSWDIASSLATLQLTIGTINAWREEFVKTGDKEAWYQIIQLLPMSYNYTRTVTMNYENVLNMIKQRTGHKLDEWNEFVDILWELPYLKEIAGEVEE